MRGFLGCFFGKSFGVNNPKIDERIFSSSASSSFRNFSLVVKVVEANNQPTVKLTNNINKASGTPEAIADYIRIFGHTGRGKQSVEV